jgi:hypothetical protein
MRTARGVVAAVLLGGAALGCGGTVGRGVVNAPDASAAERFAAFEGRYDMLSTSAGSDGRTGEETGVMDLWVEADGAVRMSIALGGETEPEGWAELRQDAATGRVRLVTETGRFEPSVETWDGGWRSDGTLALERERAGDGEDVEAVFSFPDEGSVRLLITERDAAGAVLSTEDYRYTRAGEAQRLWVPPVPPPSGGETSATTER